jgi:hypothetical protein
MRKNLKYFSRGHAPREKYFSRSELRRSKLHIIRFGPWAEAYSFRCSSSSKLKHRLNYEKDVLPESSSNAASGITPYSGK